MLNSVIHQFFAPKNKDSFIIPPDFFGEIKTFFWLKYRIVKKSKILPFTNRRYRIVIKWITRKIKNHCLKLKVKTHILLVGKCWSEHNKPTEKEILVL